VPPIKDIYYFDRYYKNGPDWYLNHFVEASGWAKAIGELSHDYLFSAEAAHRIAKDLPGVKLLTCLRDPVERTFSHYLYLVRSGLTKDSFEDALQKFPELVNNSMYAKHLSRYFSIFNGADIRVLLFDDLKADARAFARQVFAFIGIRYVESLPYDQRVLQAGRARSVALARAVKLGANFFRDVGMNRIVGRVKTSPFARLLYKDYESTEKPAMSASMRERLRELFLEDLTELEPLIGRDLTAWRRST
jgi:hypothetical protein